MFPFNILDYPLCLEKPQRLTSILSWQEHIPFAFAIVQMVHPRMLVELGTHQGDSYCAFCQAVQALNIECSCHAVDTWKGDEEAGFYGPEVLEELRFYHDPLYGDFSQLIKSTFDDALNQFSDNTIDLLHIDGLHTYEAVHHDFTMWLPKMSNRGVMLFHDIEVRDAGFGVWRLWEELKPRYPSLEFYHGNGLGVLGTGKDMPEEIRSLFAMRREQKKQVADLFFYLGSRLTIENRLHRECDQALSQKDRMLQELASRAASLSKNIEVLTEHSRNAERRAQEFESRLLANVEHNSFLIGRVADLEAHVANLERIVSHPLIRALRAGRRIIKQRG